MNYEEWQATVPEEIRSDSLWRMAAYRLALFVGDLAWQDIVKLAQDRRMLALSDQLYRASGSIGANLAEGYSRGTGRDRARFYEYALGSAREARHWYYEARHVLGPDVTQHRLQLATRVIQLILVMAPHQRGHALRDESEPYNPAARPTSGEAAQTSPPLGDEHLHSTPMP